MDQGLTGAGTGSEVGYVGETGIYDCGKEMACWRRHQGTSYNILQIAGPRSPGVQMTLGAVVYSRAKWDRVVLCRAGA